MNWLKPSRAFVVLAVVVAVLSAGFAWDWLLTTKIIAWVLGSAITLVFAWSAICALALRKKILDVTPMMFSEANGKVLEIRSYELAGIFRIVEVPTNAAWPWRLQQDADGETMVGYGCKKNGWRILWFPDVFTVPGPLLTLKPMDVKDRKTIVSTTRAKVEFLVDLRVLITDPVRFFARSFSDNPREVVEQYVDAAINLGSSFYTDTGLAQATEAELETITTKIRGMLNDFFSGGDQNGRALAYFGLHAEIFIKRIELTAAGADALQEATASEIMVATYMHRAAAIKEIIAALPPGTPAWAKGVVPLITMIAQELVANGRIINFPFSGEPRTKKKPSDGLKKGKGKKLTEEAEAEDDTDQEETV